MNDIKTHAQWYAQAADLIETRGLGQRTYLVKRSAVHPMSTPDAETLATRPNGVRDVETVLQSVGCESPLLAESLFRDWSHRADARAGRTRVRIAVIGGA